MIAAGGRLGNAVDLERLGAEATSAALFSRRITSPM
jgi:hypothetical protein